jgi:protein-disulfide isomerase
VAIVQYSDFECPFCGAFARDTWPAIKEEYIERGTVLVAFRHLPLPMHRFAKSAAASAECAKEQGRFWEMHDLLFQQDGGLDESRGSLLASTLRLDRKAFDACLHRPHRSVTQDQASADRLGISSTPTFLIGTVQSDRSVKIAHVLIGAKPFARFKEVFDELLRVTPADRFGWLHLTRH